MVVQERHQRRTAAKPKILVVDDEPDNLDLLYRTFYRDFKVLRAESGQAALAALEEQPDIAVIISDQRMPGMSGTELLRLTADRYPSLIRIMLTGYTDVEDLVDAINQGKVFKYVTKPWEEVELKAVVQQAVDTHNVLQARTQELNRVLRQETLLNAVTQTIRSAQTSQQMLQTIAETLGSAFEVDYCVIKPFYAVDLKQSSFAYSADSAESEPQLLDQLAQTVWETQQIEILDPDESLANDPRLAVYQALGIRSSIVVPLLCKQELMAVLALHQARQERPWDESQIRLLTTLAGQAALALSQTWTYERVQSLAQREVLINTITQAIHVSLDPKEIFAAITQQLGQALQVDSCALSLWTEQDQFVQCVGLYDALDPDAIAPAPADPLPNSHTTIAHNPVLQKLLEVREPVVIDNTCEQPEVINDTLSLHSTAWALLIVPLLIEGKIIGSITLRQVTQPRHWQTDEVNFVRAVAHQAAIAVQQGHLYQTTRQQAEQLLELDEQKTAFFQNISHEFRTPLTLTIGPLESAVERQEGLNYEQSVIALRNSRRLLRLVNQLLDLQRLDAGRMQSTFRPCNLARFAEEVVESFQTYCERKEITLLTEIQPDVQVYLDLEKFDKVLYNLLSNAMKFTPAGQSITVRLTLYGERCRLQVQDTGIGIREDQIPHLFERFRQADGSANRRYEGTGLGLSLVKELSELHGGQVTVDSIYGEGTTFTIELPLGAGHLPPEQVVEQVAGLDQGRAAVELADIETESACDQAPAELPPLAESTPATFVGAQLLVVDDNPDLRTYVSSVLQRQGYLVRTANQGSAGLELAESYQPDLIITDLMMPGVSGLELIQRIRRNPDLQGTPIILLTAKVDSETRLEGVEQGADAYLSKPFNDRELLAEVRNLLALKANERRVAELNRYLTESVLQRFLPPALVKKAGKGDLMLDLRPEPRLVTILFSDIVGFTQLSNTLRSRRVAELLNEYLEAMTRAIFNNGGTVDKFMGDAVVAMFGAPEDLSPNEQVRRAIAAARQMYTELEGLNARWAEQEIGPVQFRCGIHQGTAVVGMFGSSERADYTAIGPTVNIAARIQEAADAESILVSAAVADYLDEAEIAKHSPLKLKGIDETVLTFSVDIKVD
ncbi:response regulator [Romeria aff. gracilis LEGE 07310]|uniref:histidine kinase n=1 Tax=Vasconcelosia minhoensis LEGE 07310 TaxID=915328 RepID=A0A8J7AU13_9CYAN|nr:response regulator [Romeria gracilis]MBE9076608.1 response regulator [Romeria aff. gracilis LEGE 07310]